MKICEKCGVENKEESVFCASCGKELLANAEVESNNGGQGAKVLEDNEKGVRKNSKF